MRDTLVCSRKLRQGIDCRHVPGEELVIHDYTPPPTHGGKKKGGGPLRALKGYLDLLAIFYLKECIEEFFSE